MTTNKTTTMAGLVLAASIVLGVQTHADEWDFGTVTDNGISTDNVLFHGSEQTHDMAGLVLGTFPDQDWYLTSSRQFSSYEFVIDGMTGDLGLAPTDVQRLDGLGAVVLENALSSDSGGILSLNWLKGEGVLPTANLIRVAGAACGGGCDSLDRYRARFYDTTYTIPRFNNSGTQTTVLLVHNASDRSCIVTFFFLDPAGVLLSSSTAGTVNPNSLLVIATATAVPNVSGSVRIAHTCGYGGLSGKAVSIEASTGFTFDTQMLHRPH
jgi:hypothetical protein